MGFFRMHRTLPRYRHSYEQRIEYRIIEIRCHLGTTATRAWHTQHGRSPSKVISFTTILFPSVLISIYSKNNRNKQNWHCKKTIGCVRARATCMSGQRHTPFYVPSGFFYYHAVCRVYEYRLETPRKIAAIRNATCACWSTDTYVPRRPFIEYLGILEYIPYTHQYIYI